MREKLSEKIIHDKESKMQASLVYRMAVVEAHQHLQQPDSTEICGQQRDQGSHKRLSETLGLSQWQCWLLKCLTRSTLVTGRSVISKMKSQLQPSNIQFSRDKIIMDRAHSQLQMAMVTLSLHSLRWQENLCLKMLQKKVKKIKMSKTIPSLMKTLYPLSSRAI